VGFNEGLNVGSELGFVVGFNEGFNVGTNVGLNEGFNVGSELGFVVGFNEGFDVGVPMHVCNGEVFPDVQVISLKLLPSLDSNPLSHLVKQLLPSCKESPLTHPTSSLKPTIPFPSKLGSVQIVPIHVCRGEIFPDVQVISLKLLPSLDSYPLSHLVKQLLPSCKESPLTHPTSSLKPTIPVPSKLGSVQEA
jgi:hypothetical protein